MSNYPNMSYCMCENTLMSLQQVLAAMEDEGRTFTQDMSREESRAYKELFCACEAFVRAAEELDYPDEDGQPDEAQEWHDFDPDC